jgi:hypothetical protein
MTIFVLTLLFMIVVVVAMAVGVLFGRDSIKGSCGGASSGNCVCILKCARRRRFEMAEKV